MSSMTAQAKAKRIDGLAVRIDAERAAIAKAQARIERARALIENLETEAALIAQWPVIAVPDLDGLTDDGTAVIGDGG
jgi:cell division protein FtsB